MSSFIKNLAIVILTLMTTTVALAAVARAEDPSTYVMCRNQKTVRTIRIENMKTADSACVTKYTKAGVDYEVGRAIQLNSCVRVMENIRTNLEKANWKCKTVGEATMTSTSEPEKK